MRDGGARGQFYSAVAALLPSVFPASFRDKCRAALVAPGAQSGVQLLVDRDFDAWGTAARISSPSETVPAHVTTDSGQRPSGMYGHLAREPGEPRAANADPPDGPRA